MVANANQSKLADNSWRQLIAEFGHNASIVLHVTLGL